jgi:hypothetical protein
VLNISANDLHINYANWLFRKIGKTDDILELENIVADNIYFSGSIVVLKSINVNFLLKAGRGINAGEGFCIFAGLSIKLEYWKISAKVIAKEKPINLISGHFEKLQ